MDFHPQYKIDTQWTDSMEGSHQYRVEILLNGASSIVADTRQILKREKQAQTVFYSLYSLIYLLDYYFCHSLVCNSIWVSNFKSY